MAKRRRKKLKPSQVASKIVDVEEASPFVKVLVYGRNGKGKTRFAASAPNCLILDINEEGTLSARSFKGTKVFHIKNWYDIPAVYWYLRKGDHPYQSVALDTLTAMQTLAMDQVLYEGYERDQNKDPKVPTKRDWGTTATMMKEQINNFRNLPMNVIFTAQERHIGGGDEEDDEEKLITADLPAGSRGAALGAVQVIGRAYKKEVKAKRKGKRRAKSKWEFRLFVGDHKELDTKDRTGSLGTVLREPSVPKIIKAVTVQEEDK
jgi:hypothetical protein